MSHRLTVEFDERKIDAVFAELDQCRLPGAAVGIAIKGRPRYRKGFGLASMELPIVLSPTIRMRIGSTSKHFASAAFLLLCEEGRAGIDDPIGKFLPELHAVTRGVTLRQLMGHLGGLRDVFDLTWQFSGSDRFISSEALLSMYRDIDDVNAVPGKTWLYSNGGYLMLSVAIERITGNSFEQVLRERLFEPIGMYATLVRRSERGVVPNSASLHMTHPAGGYQKSVFFGTDFLGEGGIASTVDDMLRWLAHLDTPVVGSAATWETLKAPLTVANGTSTRYGLGLFTGNYRGLETLHHPGGGMGGSAQMLKVPAAGLDVIVMANRADASPMLLVDKILDACLPGLEPITEPFSGPFASGIFRSRRTGRVIQLFGRQGQQIASIDGMDMPVEPDEAGVLRPAGLFQYAQQTVIRVGHPIEPTSLNFSDCGNVDELARERPAGNVDVSAISGTYRSGSTRTEITIYETGDGPRLTTAGRFGSVTYRLESLADRIWRAMPTSTALGGVLVFEEDAETFRFSCPRTWALPFRRVD